MPNDLHFCRICGLDHGYAPWGEFEDCPDHNICECCGCEFGYEDCQYSAIISNREEWLKKGAKWFIPKLRPADWNLEEQLKNIPEKYR